MSALANVSRRDFLKTGVAAGSGLVVGFYLPPRQSLAAFALESPGPFAPNAFLSVGTDGSVTIWVAKSEMGQGVQTSLPMLVAEELEADWSRVRIEQAPADPKYGNQDTGGSTSVREGWESLRKAGAVAREMLKSAAAERWGVERETCRAEKGEVIHAPSGRRLGYGELAEAAARLPVPEQVSLKDAKDFRLLGRRFPRLDTPAKVDGSARFGLDVKVPGMLFAAVARCSVFGGKVARFDAGKARAIEGVRQVVPVANGVAVVAETTWAAMQGAAALDITWDEGPHAGLSSAGIRQMFAELAQKPGAAARKEGDAENALAGAAKKLEAVYEVPFLAHAAMEPMNCTADVRRDRCEVWAPTQSPGPTRETAAKITGLPLDSVTVHVTLLGGGFGRRFEQDFVTDAVEISKAVGAPVKVVWSREEDIQHDFYRPASYHRLSAGLDRDGNLVAWTHRLVGPSIIGRFGVPAKDIVNEAADGAANLPYAIPNVEVDYVVADTAVPVGWWRSVWNSQNAFANECFLDELAAAAGKDPYQLRLQLLSRSPRHKAVLELAATKAGWGNPVPAGRHRGIAVHESFGSYVAQVAEVSVARDGAVRVHRVVCAVDCGLVVNPDTIEAQMEGGIVYGLTAALKGAITIDKGRVEQSNFHDYAMLRIEEMPGVEVHIVPSNEPPGGVGEPGLPPIAPAVVNAVFAATGKRIRQLPIRAEELKRG